MTSWGPIHLWRRWVSRALELKVTVPDPLVLMQVLGKLSDAVPKIGSAQVYYTVNSYFQLSKNALSFSKLRLRI
jgi:hypothetical protein